MLIPDFDGIKENIKLVIDAAPDVISHNVETVRRLTPLIRTKAKYERSLEVIRYISDSGKVAKSGLMLGLGEKEEEVADTIRDLRASGCRVITIGQYLQPTAAHMEVVEYVNPSKFEEYRIMALEAGFSFAECRPLVRSSFHAENHVKA